MVRQEEPDDYVIASGGTYSVQDFLEEAFSHVGLDWGKYVEIDPWYYSLHRVSFPLAARIYHSGERTPPLFTAILGRDPVIFILLMLGTLGFFLEGSALAPTIYSIFW